MNVAVEINEETVDLWEQVIDAKLAHAISEMKRAAQRHRDMGIYEAACCEKKGNPQ